MATTPTASAANKLAAAHAESTTQAIPNSLELPTVSQKLTEVDLHQLLVEWNATTARFPQDDCFHRLFEKQVARTPDAEAVYYEGANLSYRELNERANRLAHYLRKHGVGAEVLVGLCVERSVEMVVGLLGVLKAGGAYVPLDPAHPEERLAYMLDDSRVEILLTSQRLLNLFPQHVGMFICLDGDWPMIEQECAENPVGDAHADQLAYVIYTSGSTGQPKGVLIEHQSIVNLSVGLQRAVFGQAEADMQTASEPLRVSLNAPITFDCSIQQLQMLLYGHALYILPDVVRRDADAMLLYLRDQELDVLDCTPSQLKVLTGQGLLATGARAPKFVLVGGEAIDEALWQRLADQPGTHFFNVYGPTECTVDSTVAPIAHEAIRPNIGRPINNAQVYLLDANLQPVPIGVPGELCIGGVGLARGYLNRPELTADTFVPHPFEEMPGARMYRTGDLARYLADGTIEFLGRIDDQVKIRGYRIELGEIEQSLLQHDGVREAVVMVREDVRGDKRLVGYVIAEACAVLTTSELRSFLRVNLPDYMVPSTVVQMETFPLTPNGKVDRRALPVPEMQRSDLAGNYVAPRTEVEAMLVDIWGEILGTEQIGIEDDFFELGGHSLLATQILSRVREAFQVELYLLNFFEAPTVAGLAATVERMRIGGQQTALQAIKSYPRTGQLPLSFAQERVWFVQQLNPSSAMSYNVQATIRFRGALDPLIWERSLNELVKRHEIFRVTFPAVDGRPVLQLHEHEYIYYPLIDLRGVAESERETTAKRLIEEELSKPFDLTKLPLVRWTLLQLGDEEFVMIHVESHLLHDGWSMNVLLGEMMEVYSAFAAGKLSPLPELPIQFADFTQWHREWMHGEEAGKQLLYWKQKLAGSPPALELPTDRPRSAVLSHQGSVLRVELPHDLCEGLRSFSKKEGVTLFITLLSAFKSLLYRYTGQGDLVVGSGIANRRLKETERLIGMIVNNMVLRTQLTDDLTFRELLAQVRKVALEANAHQDLPFDKVVEALHPERDLSRNPVAQVMFSFHDSPLSELKIPGIDVKLTEALGNGSAKFDLNVVVIPRAEQRVGKSTKELPKGITMVLEYSTDLFDESTIVRLVEHFKTLLSDIMKRPECRLAELTLLTEVEQQTLLTAWSGTQTEYPQVSIHELFAEQAQCTPDAVALVFGGQEMTYGELNGRANQVAHHLQAMGVEQEAFVGLAVERSLEMVVGLLGILKCGAVCVPLDPSYPMDRLTYMMEDAQVKVLLTQQHVVEKLPSLGARMVCLDSEWAEIAKGSADDPADEVSPDQVAQVVYTSGTTGKPKGVLVPHRGVVRLVKGIDYARFSTDEVFSQFAPISFDASTFEIWAALLNGAKLVIFPPQMPSLEEFGQLLKDHGVTTLWLTTGLFHQMVESNVEALVGVRQLLYGGDVASVAHAKKALQHLPKCQVIHCYGPTENSTFTTTYALSDPNEMGSSVPIGKPICNTDMYVLDPNRQPVPVGVPGELYTGGAGLAKGYLNQPELTAEKFVPHPFSAESGARLYRTGDLVRYRGDGSIEFIGRVDNQVKIRGFRIELGEIESLLADHPAVRESVVVVLEPAPGDKRIVGYVALDEQSEQLEAQTELRTYLKDRLPGYMVPSVVMVIEALPLTVSGKVDRKALPAPDFSQTELAGEYVAPRTLLERTLAGIWQETLRVEQVGVWDHFFERGGHSMMAIQLLSRVRQTLGVVVPMHRLFEAPRIAELAQVIEAIRGGDAAELQAAEQIRRERAVISPLSFDQEELWHIEQSEQGNTLYNVNSVLYFNGTLDAEALKQALNELTVRHEMLRTRFDFQGGRPVMVIEPEWQVDVAMLDLRGLPRKKRVSEAKQFRIACGKEVFDLTRLPLLKAYLLQLGDEEHQLVLNRHHIITDGWSNEVYMRELSVLYKAFANGESSPLNELPIQYTDFVRWQREWLQGERLERLLSYWKEKLAGAPTVLDLPTDYTRPTVRTYRGAKYFMEMTVDLEERLRAFCQREDVTMNMVLLAAFKLLLVRFSGQEELLVGTPMVNRDRVEMQDMIGYLISILIMRGDLSGDPSVKELLARVRETALGAYAHKEMPVEMLMQGLELAHDPSRNSLYQVMFVHYASLEAQPLEFPGLNVNLEHVDSGTSEFELMLVLGERDGVIRGRMEYNTDLFKLSTVEWLVKQYFHFLAQMVETPERKVMEMEMLTRR